jgi:hypothetical protein
MDAYNRRLDRGLSGNSVQHRSITSVVYELPFGKGRSVAIANPVANTVLGGWTIGYIGEFRTGAPLGVSEQVNQTNAFSPSNRPIVVGNPTISGSRSRGEQVAQWFNTSAFAAPPQFTFGNAGKITGFGPGAIALDLSVLKDFVFLERYTLQFRMEMMNFTNTPNFGLPNVARGNAAFGRITTLVDGNQSRITQFGLHFRF